MRSQRSDIGMARELRHLSPQAVRTMIRVRRDRLTYLEAPAMVELAGWIGRTERAGIPGAIIETGTALGGSALVMAARKNQDRHLHLYDMFGMIPPPTDADGADVHDRYATIVSGKSQGLDGEQYYGYHDDLLGEVRSSFSRYGLDPARNNVTFHQGLFQETLAVDGPVALGHLDGDWYESTKVCLERIAPHISPGGRMVIDDYQEWSGCRTAVDEFLASADGGVFTTEQHTRLHLVRS